MNDATPSPVPEPALSVSPALGTSSMYRLCEEFIALREQNARQHRVFEQALARTRDALQAAFHSFAADTQRAYQQLRQELQGEARTSLVLLNELLDVGTELERIVAARPAGGDDLAAWHRWADAVAVEARKVADILRRHSVVPYHAVVGTAYNPALHERVGTRRLEGMGPDRIAEQCEPGWASQQPGFVLRRPKVLVSE
ncbi:MAG: nucleotide exchange factor GrpE [Gemmataceae bacterium]|nr:nucleotide exchange factor GrpE [Gemmataceae bacterium]MDW8266452.1 nucleotide exchange factor GrpE [Gemmataceae bacterium]